MQQFIDRYIAQHQSVLTDLAAYAGQIEQFARRCTTALDRGNKLLICGNGGSAADAQHMAAELIGRFVSDRRALAAIALTTDTSALTAIANDYGYESVFSRQVAGLAREGDVLLAISTSGNSASVLAACDTARSMGCEVIGLSGRDGGELKEYCDALVIAPSDETAHIQECHIVVVHLLCALIEQGLGLA
ncbi:MAG: D-sedoheptulose 7-phosphate isomerase [Luminiphilus sp.]|nr:D-sedoheptulose 7-phosphate isomerase [Luminiphilus sp.]